MGCVLHKIFLGIMLFILLSGCGTIYTEVTTDPENAEIFLNNQYKGPAPITLKLVDDMERNVFHIEARKEGYISEHVTIAEFSKGAPPSDWIPSKLNLKLKKNQYSASLSTSTPSNNSINEFNHKNEKTFLGEKKYWAVVIGISKYQYSSQSGLTNLIFADDDAKVFARSLSNLGWPDSHIKLLVNNEATQRNIMIAL